MVEVCVYVRGGRDATPKKIKRSLQKRGCGSLKWPQGGSSVQHSGAASASPDIISSQPVPFCHVPHGAYRLQVSTQPITTPAYIFFVKGGVPMSEIGFYCVNICLCAS